MAHSPMNPEPTLDLLQSDTAVYIDKCMLLVDGQVNESQRVCKCEYGVCERRLGE